jgi:voltage-gated potassium channel
MVVQLTLATLMVVVTVLVHLFGLAVLMRILRSHTRIFRTLSIMPLTLLLAATTGIIAIHTVEIWMYAALYLQLGAFGHFEEALYFSTVTYATIGYGDVLMPHQWRILGAIEGAAGIIMLGWSTAFLISLLTQMKLIGHDWLTREPSAHEDKTAEPRR